MNEDLIIISPTYPLARQCLHIVEEVLDIKLRRKPTILSSQRDLNKLRGLDGAKFKGKVVILSPDDRWWRCKTFQFIYEHRHYIKEAVELLSTRNINCAVVKLP